MNVPLPSISFEKRRQEASLEAWSKSLSQEWLNNFLQQGLQKFLRQNGYNLQISEQVKARFVAWTWSHEYVLSKKGMKMKSPEILHNGGSEEYDYYSYVINYDKWEYFLDKWKRFKLFDETDVGVQQRADLPFFAWSVLDLASSSSHHKWKQLINYQSDDSDKEGKVRETEYYEQAYGGDRRTL